MNNISKRTLIISMSVLGIIGLGIASLYYGEQNKKVDPRTLEARKLYEKYDTYAEQNDFASVLLLLDSVENAYNKTPHYQDSYEMAVLDNNRAATYLTMAIHFEPGSLSLDGVEVLSRDTLLQLSKRYSRKAIDVYERWLDTYGEMDPQALKKQIRTSFFKGMEEPDTRKRRNYLDKRVEEMQLAQLENKRRLSVAYTNQGIVLRHEKKYQAAMDMYKEALALWERNLAAKNSLNVLLGNPIEKQNILQKMFPPEKDKE